MTLRRRSDTVFYMESASNSVLPFEEMIILSHEQLVLLLFIVRDRMQRDLALLIQANGFEATAAARRNWRASVELFNRLSSQILKP